MIDKEQAKLLTESYWNQFTLEYCIQKMDEKIVESAKKGETYTYFKIPPFDVYSGILPEIQEKVKKHYTSCGFHISDKLIESNHWLLRWSN